MAAVAVRLTVLGLLYLLIEYYIHKLVRFFHGKIKYNEENIVGKIVIITGANCGLGKYTTLEMAKRGATVIMGCRNLIEGQKTLEEIKKQSGSNKVILMELDLSDLSSVRNFAKEIKSKYPAIHILINNGGIDTFRKQVEYTKDGHEIHFGVNHLGHFLLTNLLLNTLKNGTPSRVITVSSTLMMLEELNMDDLNLREEGNKSAYSSLHFISGMIYKPYNNSKFANSLFTAELGKILEGSDVTTYTLCPGFVATDVFRYLPWYRKLIININLIFLGLTPEQGIETILYCALSEDCKQETGQFYRFCKLYRVGNKKLNDEQELAKRLWDESVKMVGLKTHHS